ncbi:TauD/TfdA family dioxygenase [Streptomyces abikoensis]|uniref:TauD/TfdA family dioxygenase n=1 Tax=Streptomyces abikoensis TaxID=97398 RepID=UPI00367AFFA0
MALVAEIRRTHRLNGPDREKLWKLSEMAARFPDAGAGAMSFLRLDLPPALREPLLDFAEGTSPHGHLLLRGLDVGDVPPTPAGQDTAALDGHPTDGTLTLVADLLGSLVGYQDEKSGALIHDVHPVPGEETRIENSGSVAFDFHTENVHHPLRPDFLGLLCLRRDHDGVAATRVASVREAIAHLTPEDVAALRQPVYHSAYPSSFTRDTAAGPPPLSGPHPVIFGDPDRAFLRFNSHHTHAADTRGTRALDALARALETVCQDIVLEPGDLVIVDNHVAAHGRSAFAPRYDGADRWLRRFYSLRSTPLWARRMMRRPRVIPRMADIRGVV